VVKVLVEACDAKQVALHEPLLAVLFDATNSRTGATHGVQKRDDQTEGSALGSSDDVGYRTYTFGGTVVAEGTVVALRYASRQCAFVLDARPASYDRPTRAAVLRPGRLLGCSLKRDPIEWTTRCGVQMLNGSIWRRNRNEYSRVACWALPRRLLLRSAVAARRTTDCGTRLWLWDRWTRGM
jgi:hypothetical protein